MATRRSKPAMRSAADVVAAGAAFRKLRQTVTKRADAANITDRALRARVFADIIVEAVEIATGKLTSVTIEAASGLSNDEIKRLAAGMR